MAELPEQVLNARLKANVRLLLEYFGRAGNEQLAVRFIQALLVECSMQLPDTLVSVSEGRASISSDARMSKVWQAVHEALQRRFDAQWGPVFVSALRWPLVSCHELADNFDSGRHFNYTCMEAKVKRIESIARSLGALLSAEFVRDAAVSSRPDPLAAPTPRDLSRCVNSADLILLLVRSDRVACLEPLCVGDSERAPAAALLSELRQLMAEFTRGLNTSEAV